MRPAQNLNPLQIEIFCFEQARGQQRNVVAVYRRRAVAGETDAQIANAANGEGGCGEVALGEHHIWQAGLKVERVVDLLLVQRFLAESGYRDRHVLQPLCLALCSDDDLPVKRRGNGLRACLGVGLHSIGVGLGHLLSENGNGGQRADGARD